MTTTAQPSRVVSIRNGIYITGVSSIIWDAMARFVTVLCDGAFDTEGESAHADVIELAYVMSPSVTHNWGAWPEMIQAWREDGRAPTDIRGLWARFGSDPLFAADLVAGAIADGLRDGLLIVTEVVWGDRRPRDRIDQAAVGCIYALAAIASPPVGDRLRRCCEAALTDAIADLTQPRTEGRRG